MDKSANLIEEAKKAVSNPQNPDNQTRLAQVAKAVSQALNNCVNCLPGLREVDVAVKYLTTVSMKLSQPQFPRSDRGFQEVQMNLNTRAADLNQATSDIVTAASQADAHRRVAPASNRFGHAYEDFIDSGLEMAGVTQDTNTQTQIVTGLRSVSMVSSRFLMATKSLLVDPNAPNAKNQLTQAARAVTESINHLINVCTVSAPGQKECDNALRQIQATRPLMENPSEPISDGTYFDSLEGIIEKSKALADAMTGISTNAKQGELHGFCDCVAHFANAVCGIIENSAQAAYLVGIADPASEPGRPGLVDQSQFARANQAIQTACQSISNPASSPQQVLSAATLIAKHTSALCNTCRMASSKTTNPVAKRHFVQSAKDVANSTANLVRAIKVLDSEFTDENRKKCAEAAKPLLQAVDVLSSFASSPEFASVPAKISDKARRAQQPITSGGKDLIDGACNMVLAAKQLAVNPKDPPIYQAYSTHSHSVSEAIKKLVTAVREGAPGHRECDSSIHLINRLIHDLDQASLGASSQTGLRVDGAGSMQSYQEQVLSSARQLLEHIDPIRSAAKGETENLAHLVNSASNYFEPLKAGAIGCASKTVSSKLQMALLDQTKTVIESMQNLMVAAKEAGGNRKASHAHSAVDETADSAREMLQELIQTLEDTAASSGIVTVLVENLAKAIARTDERPSVGEDTSFVDYQTNLVRLAKQIARTAQEMMSKSVNNVQELGTLANSLTRDYSALAGDCRGAVAASANPQVGSRIKSSVQQLGNSCIDLVRDAGNLQCNPSDAFAKRDLSDHAKKVLEHVSNVLLALQAGSRGTQACINAASTVSGIIGDLDTTIMFATAGTLNADKDESFSDHRENILKTAKALVEDTKTLVAGAASNQEQLAGAAQSAVMTITRLAECVKHGAASLGSEQPEAQVLLINAVKDVASALSDLILATKNASGKSAHDPAMSNLKDTAKVMVTNVTSLLKTVKTVEDEAARGTQALESSIEAIGQEMRAYAATEHVEKKISPDELVRLAKPITIATARAVAAGNSGRQDDVIAAANMGRKAVFDLLHACQSAAAGVDDSALQRRVLTAGNTCAAAYKELLEQINVIIQRPSMDSKQKLALISKRVAAAMTEIIQAAEAIKGSEWVDPYDPTVVAESELLSAASSIEAAARKLAQLEPRQQTTKQADDSLSFEEQIVGAAKSIAAATAALVKAASVAQRELMAQGKIGMVTANMDEDSQWSQGLISAARLVAAATHNLCDAANALVQGQATEEKLISSAKQVASSTAQLLVACKVKADPNSMAMRRLQAAGNAVKRATEALVSEAQRVRGWSSYEETTVTVDQRMVGSMAQLITAQEDILIKERELESARKKLEIIRMAKYKNRQEYDSTDSGTDF
jgi:talin